MATLMRCMDIYPISNTLLSYLSATDSAILLGVTGKLYSLTEKMKSKYLNIYKDVPKYASWMEAMLSKDHTLLLVGADLEVILCSYKFPLTYWKTHDRKEERTVWLVSLAMKMYKDAYGASMGYNTLEIPATDEAGDIHLVPRFSPYNMADFHLPTRCKNLLCYPQPLSLSITLPPPTRWPSCTESIMERDSWLPLSLDNDSNISVLCLQSYCREEKLYSEVCEYLPSILGCGEKSNTGQTASYRVPYMNLRNGRIKTSNVEIFQYNGFDLEYESNTPWGSDSDYDIFSIAFYRNVLERTTIGGLGVVLDDDYEVVQLNFEGLDPDS
ncbi:hypothetical protein B0T10DRAFT_531115 [Thelonectria olida]|uniref:Uncharacterized protein n=1 Tax=Thelonectria olida TaxID=1576542 RepID=A0A9P8VZP3_9HYPO|nr:hypothetical protein B0T10DRAFT_531115 [Thelonectria olida]